MQETLFRTPRLKAYRQTGAEGPRHDPYSYEELTVETPSGKIILHEGLGTWVEFHDVKPGRRARPTKRMDERLCSVGELRKIFEDAVGLTINQIDRIHRKLKSRCCKCGSTKGTDTVPGYPGEYLEVCVNCGHINGGYFCREEIE